MFLYLTAADLSSPFVSDFKICTSLLIAPLCSFVVDGVYYLGYGCVF